MVRRTTLSSRMLPDYTRGEEIFNMVSHIVGGAIGIVALAVCVITAAWHQNAWGVVSGAIYGGTLILLFSMSSIYHGLTIELPKKVFQIIDHCTIFLLIAGTYTPILLNSFRREYPLEAWLMFGIVWALALVGVALNSIDLKRYAVFSMICYLGMGWMVVFSMKKVNEVLGGSFSALMIIGGILYTVGALFYLVGAKRRYMHSVFHIFVDLGALTHFLGIAIFVMPAAG